MSRKINVEKTDVPDEKPWLTLEFYKTKNNKTGFDLKLNTGEISEQQKAFIIESENLICKWLSISNEEFNKHLAKKLEEIYPQLKEIH